MSILYISNSLHHIFHNCLLFFKSIRIYLIYFILVNIFIIKRKGKYRDNKISFFHYQLEGMLKSIVIICMKLGVF